MRFTKKILTMATCAVMAACIRMLLKFNKGYNCNRIILQRLIKRMNYNEIIL